MILVNGIPTCIACANHDATCDFDICISNNITTACLFGFVIFYGVICFPFFFKLNVAKDNSRPFAKFIYRQKLKMYFLTFFGAIANFIRSMLLINSSPNGNSIEVYCATYFLYSFAGLSTIAIIFLIVNTGIIIMKYFDLRNEIPMSYELVSIVLFSFYLLILVITVIIAYIAPKYSGIFGDIFYYMEIIPSSILSILAMLYSYRLRKFFKNSSSHLTTLTNIYAAVFIIYGCILYCFFVALAFSKQTLITDFACQCIMAIGATALLTILSFRIVTRMIQKSNYVNSDLNYTKNNVTKAEVF